MWLFLDWVSVLTRIIATPRLLWKTLVCRYAPPIRFPLSCVETISGKIGFLHSERDTGPRIGPASVSGRNQADVTAGRPGVTRILSFRSN